MIITKSPFRISFIGGGSDMEEFYARHEGAVLSTTINKYMYISSHRFFDTDKIRIKYSKSETVTDINEISHPIIREALRKFKISGAIEISSNADIPAGTGLGSSSAFTAALLANLYYREGRFINKPALARETCEIEIEKLHEPIGKQDQYSSVFGGLNVIRFKSSGETVIEPLHLRRDIYKTLQNNLLLFFTGQVRSARTILQDQRENIARKDPFATLVKMTQYVDTAKELLYAGKLDDFARLLHENWELKKQLSAKISNPDIEDLYKKGLENGALGGKLLGAGGGGFILFYCPQDRQEKLRKALADYRELKFKFEHEGCQLIYSADEYPEA